MTEDIVRWVRGSLHDTQCKQFWGNGPQLTLVKVAEIQGRNVQDVERRLAFRRPHRDANGKRLNINTRTREQNLQRVLVAAVRAVQLVQDYAVDDMLVALTCVCQLLKAHFDMHCDKKKFQQAEGIRTSKPTQDYTMLQTVSKQSGLVCGL